MTERFLISIASYRRPELLRRLLDSLEVSVPPGAVDIVIVDNDPDGSARDVAEAHALTPTYVLEVTPGIASARNAGLDHFTENHTGIIFVDDDEWVAPDWFDKLTSFSARFPADVVNGPVLTVIPPTAPSWVARGGFFQRPAQNDGQILPSAATNNTLLYRDAWVRTGKIRFDTTFSSTGGSDWDFFWAIRRGGSVIRFAADVVVYEDVPPERLSVAWIKQRSIRNGIVNTRVRLKHHEPMAKPLARGIARLLFNSILIVRDVVTRKGLQSKPVNAVLHEYGKFAGLLGHRIHEYKR